MSVRELMQKREALVKEMTGLVDAADAETRALNDEESKKFEELKAELANLDKTIEAKRALEDAQITESDDVDQGEPEERAESVDTEEVEERAFEAFIRNYRQESRDDTNMTYGANGAVVPASIANKIIEKVKEICPIYTDAERYNVKGTLTIPYYDESTSQIVCGYATEFTAPDATSGKFSSISLTGFLGEALTNVSKSLINNSQFDIVNYVIGKVAEAVALFIEKELLIGTPATTSGGTTVPAKIEGLSSLAAGQLIESAANTAITADELIQVQEQVKDAYQENAYWIMNRKTRTAIRQLKESGTGAYLLNKDANSRWGYTLFGKDVYTTDNMPEVKAANAGKVAVYYGDMTGLAVKVSEDIEIEVLRETMATKHAIQVVGFVELDAKVQNSEKIAGLKLKA
jgi:HK97 family phage major capsid protein